MDFTRREIATITMIIGFVMIGASIWLERRRKTVLMPSLIPPMPLMIFGFALAMISFVIVILPYKN